MKIDKYDYSYTAKRIVEYIKVAYGEDVRENMVDLTLPDASHAIKKLGYEYERADGWFITIKPDLEVMPGDIIIVGSGVAVVTEVDRVGDFCVSNISNFKGVGYSAWWNLSEVDKHIKNSTLRNFISEHL